MLARSTTSTRTKTFWWERFKVKIFTWITTNRNKWCKSFSFVVTLIKMKATFMFGQAKEDTRLFRIHISNNLNPSSIFLLESFLIPLTFSTEAGFPWNRRFLEYFFIVDCFKQLLASPSPYFRCLLLGSSPEYSAKCSSSIIVYSHSSNFKHQTSASNKLLSVALGSSR